MQTTNDVCMLKDVLPWLPSLLTIASWWVVSRENNKREIRREQRKAADEIKESIKNLQAKSFAYYTTKDNSLEVEITQSLEELYTELDRLPNRLVLIKSVPTSIEIAYQNYYDAITDDPFKSSRRKPISKDHQVITRIFRAKQRLIAYIERIMK